MDSLGFFLVQGVTTLAPSFGKLKLTKVGKTLKLVGGFSPTHSKNMLVKLDDFPK